MEILLSEFAEEDAWVKEAQDRRVEAERMGEQDGNEEPIPFSRAPLQFARGPSALGDGKQKYYEVPFDKAVDKIVKNKRAVSRDDVFVSQTPKVFQEIGLAKLPILMEQLFKVKKQLIHLLILARSSRQ